MNLTPRRLIAAFLAALFIYLGLYTWNLRTGTLDSLAANTGLELVGLVLWPGKWVSSEVSSVVDEYVYLVDVRKENQELLDKVHAMGAELDQLREEAAELPRLRALLDVSSPEPWQRIGGQIIAHRLGPYAALNTVVINKGFLSGANQDDPVVAPAGVVGRIMRDSAHASTVLLLTAANSRIAARSATNRTVGILAGKGPGKELELQYVPLNASLEEGEILVTSGLAGLFPKGIPMARITSIERSDISLFQTVRATPLVDLPNLEEILVLYRDQVPESEPEAELDVSAETGTGADNATAAQTSSAQ